MALINIATLDALLSTEVGLVAADALNTIAVRHHVVLDLAEGIEQRSYLHARDAFQLTPWMRFEPGIDSLAAARVYLDKELSRTAVAIHVLLGGSDDDLRFRLRAGQLPRRYARPQPIGATSGSHIGRHEIEPLFHATAPARVDARTVFVAHGCDNGHDISMRISLWYALGCRGTLYMPSGAVHYTPSASTLTLEGPAAPKATFAVMNQATLRAGS